MQIAVPGVAEGTDGHMMARGEFGKMVCLVNGKTSSVALKKVAGKIKNVPLNDSVLLCGKDAGTCFGE